MLKKISLLLAVFLTMEQVVWATGTESLLSTQTQTMTASNSNSETANQQTVENRETVSQLSSSNSQTIQQNAVSSQTLTEGSAGEFLLESREGSLGLLVSYLGEEGLEHQAFTYDQAVAGIELVKEGKLKHAGHDFYALK